MTTFSFADRYAAAGVAPGPEIIALREAPAKRLLGSLDAQRVNALVQLYYGNEAVQLDWFRDEFRAEDASFSLINNGRECKLLAAAVLSGALQVGNEEAILSLRTASVGGKRIATEAQWLQSDAAQALLDDAADSRVRLEINTSLKVVVAPKLADEIAAVAIETLPPTLTKVRAEALDNSKTQAGVTTAALDELVRQMELMREETQILWWLIGGHSRHLAKAFSTMTASDAAMVCGVELAELATASRLGPIAAVAVLERAIQPAKTSKAGSLIIAEIVDKFPSSYLQKLTLPDTDAGWIFPLSTALAKARDSGPGNWKSAFERSTGLSSDLQFTPVELASQLYYEHLLWQLL